VSLNAVGNTPSLSGNDNDDDDDDDDDDRSFRGALPTGRSSVGDIVLVTLNSVFWIQFSNILILENLILIL